MHTRGANDAQEKVAGIEFVAYIPLLDEKYFTTIIIDRIMHSFLGGLAIVFSDPWAPSRRRGYSLEGVSLRFLNRILGVR